MKSTCYAILGLFLNLLWPAMAETMPQPMVSWGFDRSFENQVMDRISGSHVANVVPVRPDDRYYQFDVLNEGIWGNALYIGHRAYVETDVTVPDTFTLSFWYKPEGKEGKTVIGVKRLARWNGKVLLDVGEGKLWWNRQELAAVPEGRWVHLAVVQQGQQAQVYVNGERVSEMPVDPSMNTVLHLMDGGTDLGHNRGQAAGNLDEVRVYDWVLSQAQISELARPDFYAKELRIRADAGLDQTVWSDGAEWIDLKGSVEGEAARFTWRILKQPANAEASLSDPDQAATRLQVRGTGPL